MNCPSCTRHLPSHHRACSRCGWTPSTPPPSLSPDQAAAFEALDGKRSVYLSGGAGVGKSFLVSRWIEHAREQRRRVAVTASTGIAASHVNGRTIHSWIGCGIGKETAQQIFDDPRWAWRYRIAPRVRECQVLVVDEISMLDGRTFCLVSDLCKLARRGGWSSMAKPIPGHEKPFGGLQLLLVGDMGQLPPVEEMAGFAFETDEWHEAGIQTIELTTVHRQEEVAFARVLREIREGNLSPEGTAMLASRVNAFDPESDPPAVRLYSRNADVDGLNFQKLEAIPGLACLFAAEEGGDDKALEQIDKACLSPRDLYLKVGAPVMFTRNHPDGPSVYVNGTMGVVTWLSDDPQGGMEVTTSTGQVLYPERHLWQSGVDGSDLWALEKPGDAAAHGRARRLVKRREPGKGEAYRLQYPLRLAWAVTMHKCVHPDTLVETGAGMVRLGLAPDVGRIGTMDGMKDYAGFVRNPQGPGLRIRTKRGFEIRVTPDHGLMVNRGFGMFSSFQRVDAKDVVAGDVVRLVRGFSDHTASGDLSLHKNMFGDVREEVYRTPSEVNASVAEFLGFMVGDGTIYPGGFRLAKRHRDVVARFASLVSEIFGVDPRIQNKPKWDVAEVSSRFLSRWLLQISGLAPNEKAIPDVILRAPLQLQCFFLRGLFEDGSVQLTTRRGKKFFDHVEWSTGYEEMARVVQVMLLRLGIVSTRYLCERTQKSGKQTRNWRLAIYGTDAGLFREIIGFVSAFKRERLLLCRPERSISDLTRDVKDEVVSIEPILMESVCVAVPGYGRFVQDGFDGFNCQGMTLDRVSIDISTCFAPGQAYVALSRARTLAGLNLERSFDPAVIRAHPTALRFLRGQYAPPEEVTRRIEEGRRREEEQRALDERRRAGQAVRPGARCEKARQKYKADMEAEDDLPF